MALDTATTIRSLVRGTMKLRSPKTQEEWEVWIQHVWALHFSGLITAKEKTSELRKFIFWELLPEDLRDSVLEDGFTAVKVYVYKD